LINAINIVTDSIPAPSASNEFPLPLQGPAAAANRLPFGVANTYIMSHYNDQNKRNPTLTVAISGENQFNHLQQMERN
jgi:hypothetical protein